MTREEYERGLELQGYRKSIEEMTLGNIALKFLKKYHLPKFLKKILVKFAHPLLLLTDVDLYKAKELIENIIRVTWGEGWNYSLDWKVKAEQFLKEIKENA